MLLLLLFSLLSLRMRLCPLASSLLGMRTLWEGMRYGMGWEWDLSSLSLRVVIYGAPRLSQVLAVNILGRFLVNTDKNIRCVGCVALLSVRASPPRTLPDPSWPGHSFETRVASRSFLVSHLVGCVFLDTRCSCIAGTWH